MKTGEDPHAAELTAQNSQRNESKTKMTVARAGDLTKCQLYCTGYTFEHRTNLDQVHITMIRKNLVA
jgi:hypothetical protein